MKMCEEGKYKKSSWKYFHSRHIFISVHSLLLTFVTCYKF